MRRQMLNNVGGGIPQLPIDVEPILWFDGLNNLEGGGLDPELKVWYPIIADETYIYPGRHFVINKDLVNYERNGWYCDGTNKGISTIYLYSRGTFLRSSTVDSSRKILKWTYVASINELDSVSNIRIVSPSFSSSDTTRTGYYCIYLNSNNLRFNFITYGSPEIEEGESLMEYNKSVSYSRKELKTVAVSFGAAYISIYINGIRTLYQSITPSSNNYRGLNYEYLNGDLYNIGWCSATTLISNPFNYHSLMLFNNSLNQTNVLTLHNYLVDRYDL